MKPPPVDTDPGSPEGVVPIRSFGEERGERYATDVWTEMILWSEGE
jgi:hypothetical protein